MSKINIGISLLILTICIVLFALISADNHHKVIKDQLELINAKLNDLDDDIHKLEK